MRRDYNFEKVARSGYCCYDREKQDIVLLPNAPEDIKEAYRLYQEGLKWQQWGCYVRKLDELKKERKETI